MIEPLFQPFFGTLGVDSSSSGIPIANSPTNHPVLNQPSESFASVLGQNQVFQSLKELLSPRADVTKTEQNPLAQLLATANTEELGSQGSASLKTVDNLFSPSALPVLESLISSVVENQDVNQLNALFDRTPVIAGAGHVDERVPSFVELFGLEENIPSTIRTTNLLLSSQHSTEASPFLNVSANGREHPHVGTTEFQEIEPSNVLNLSVSPHLASTPFLNGSGNGLEPHNVGTPEPQDIGSSNVLNLSTSPNGFGHLLLNGSANGSENVLAGTTVHHQTTSLSFLKLSFTPDALTGVSLNDSVNGKDVLSSRTTIQQGTISSTMLRLSVPQNQLGSQLLDVSTQGQSIQTPATPNGMNASGAKSSLVNEIFQDVERLVANTLPKPQIPSSFSSQSSGGTNPATGLDPIPHSSVLTQGVAGQTSQLGNSGLVEAGLAQSHALLSRVADGIQSVRAVSDGKIGSFVDGVGVSQQEHSGLGTSGNETFLGNQTGSGLSSSGDSQLSSQINTSHSVNTARPNALFHEQLQNLNTTPQRLQIDVQLSEAHRVQLDVGVQQRQVYASLLMDQTALRNLALQQAPQLGEQLTQVGMELREFDAEVADQSENTMNEFREKAHDGTSSPQQMSETNHKEVNPVVSNMEPDRGIHLVA